MSGKDQTDLLVWQKSVDLVVEIYRISAPFPKEEMYGLTSQLRRAAVSIPTNIAEGHGRRSQGDFRRFLLIAHGSVQEIQTLAVISQRLGYTDAENAERLLGAGREIGRMINGLIRSLKAK